MRRPVSLLLLGAAAAIPSTLAFVPFSPGSPLQQQQQRQARSSSKPLASSYYDNYDAQQARNMEQDRCVSICLSLSVGVIEWSGRVSPNPSIHPSNPKPNRPDWAGGGLVSNLVSALIGNKFLYGFMKIGARKVLIDNAEKKGVEVRGWIGLIDLSINRGLYVCVCV
jgi:hypothetical protein